MNADYFRDHDGWCGKTVLDLDDQRVVTIRTAKRRIGHGLATTVTCSTRDQNGFLTHVLSFGTGEGDYSATFAVSQPAKVTESVVRKQHAAALASIERIRSDVARFYAVQETKHASHGAKE